MKPNRHFIDLISIGIVAEDDREYYAISKEFDIYAAWNKHEVKINPNFNPVQPEGEYNPMYITEYWLRNNVLRPIFKELYILETGIIDREVLDNLYYSYKEFKYLVNKHGKTNKKIAEEIKDFCGKCSLITSERDKHFRENGIELFEAPEFYAYYADYDWVAFCSLFGSMIQLPKGFPMYCKDLKQTLDEKVNRLDWLYLRDTWSNKNMSIYTIGKGDQQEKDRPATFDEKLNRLKELNEYPKQENEHNALEDAKWNMKLHKFLDGLSV
jgi:hypothetical protein